MNDTKLVATEQLRGFVSGAADLRLTAVADAASRISVHCLRSAETLSMFGSGQFAAIKRTA